MIQDLRQHELPFDIAPFHAERRPLARLSNDEISALVEQVRAFPGKRGLYSDCVRRVLDLPPFRADRFVRFEAHLNLDDCSHELENRLIALGFEPDDFLELNPIMYTRNFTFAFDIKLGSDTAASRELFRQRLREAETLVECSSHFGFLEAEIFPSQCIMEFDQATVPAAEFLFPFKSGDFEACPIPDTIDGSPSDMSPFTRKNIDLHVKIKGRVPETPPAKEGYVAQASELAYMLASLGFYRIVSISGNTIYTAQFLDGRLGRELFEGVCQFVSLSKLAKSVILEPCIHVWRKSRYERGAEVFAPVSPIIRRK
ncbi:MULTISPECIES: hypothetical protein [unclassified Bradyrhizobium]|uniref:hypothetical protein n=1 Tax=unclassified Bradyrhizobium TaxID=2631580 RepID=UPI002916353D|nr:MULTISPECIES: hypothetical protein [unclassified Bradyrhizobium]